jgi:hypothetical protein
MDVMYFTRHVVAWHATCQSPIGSYHLLGGNMLTRGILTRGTFGSDGPRLPSFDRTAHQYAKFEKKVTYWAGICWHVACWHVADFDRTVHVYRAGIEMINCEKVRLPRQICNFCVSAVSQYGIQVFSFSKVLFSSFASAGRRIARIAIQSSKRYHWQSWGTTPGEVPTGVGRTFEHLTGRSKGLSRKTQNKC